MNEISFEDQRDDSSANSDYSAPNRVNNSTFVKLPSMLSPLSRASTNDDASIDDASNHARRKERSFSTETKDLKRTNGITSTSNIPHSHAGMVGIETTIPKCGNLLANEQQPKHNSKTKSTVRSISNAAENPYEIDKWIQSVAETHVDKSKSEVSFRNRMPTIQELLQSWPEKLGAGLRDGTLDLPPADIDLSVEEYARMMCSLMGIPVYAGCVVESVHVLLNLFVEMRTTNGMM